MIIKDTSVIKVDECPNCQKSGYLYSFEGRDGVIHKFYYDNGTMIAEEFCELRRSSDKEFIKRCKAGMTQLLGIAAKCLGEVASQ